MSHSLYMIAYLIFIKILQHSYHCYNFGNVEKEAQEDCHVWDPYEYSTEIKSLDPHKKEKPELIRMAIGNRIKIGLGLSHAFSLFLHKHIRENLSKVFWKLRFPDLLVFKANSFHLSECLLVITALAFCPWKAKEGFKWQPKILTILWQSCI